MKNKLYCCFVDYKKAFDSVPRIDLWYKLLACGINGKILNIIKAKSAVKANNCYGAFLIVKLVLDRVTTFLLCFLHYI